MSEYHFNIVAVDGEPRVYDLDVAEALRLVMPTNIRATIQTNREELSRYGELLHAPRVKGTRGRPGVGFMLTEGQALLLATFSRTERAADIRQALIQGFLDWRNGKTVPVRAHNRRPPSSRDSYAAWHEAATLGDMRDIRLRPDPSRIDRAFDVRRRELGALPYDQVLDLLARGLARLDDIAPEPLTYAPGRRGDV